MPAETDSLPRGVPENPTIENVIAMRFAAHPMRRLFSAENFVILHQEFWTDIMQGQHDLGIDIPQSVIDDYRNVSDVVDLAQIKEIELIRHHDEKARIETFNKNAGGHQRAHEPLTTRDAQDNVEQYRIKSGLEIVRDKGIAVAARHGKLAAEYATLYYADRTHNTPAQLDLLGRRFTTSGEVFMNALDGLDTFIEEYPMRGLKGAIGTQTDLLQLFDGDQSKVDSLERKIADKYGFKNVLDSIGQVYPRSLDYDVISLLFNLTSGTSNATTTLRHMAGRDQFTEGFAEGQVGSSIMPHKMNNRLLERLFGLRAALHGYVASAGMIAGDQWYEGDVSESSTRRIIIPDTFFAIDGYFESYLKVLDGCGFYPAVIEAEVDKYLPFLTTTRLLVEAVKHGIGRETAHEAIGKHSRDAALELREKGGIQQDIIKRLVADKRMEGVSEDDFRSALSNPMEFVGSAPRQIDRFVKRVEKLVEKHPEEAAYLPEEVL